METKREVEINSPVLQRGRFLPGHPLAQMDLEHPIKIKK